MDDNNLSEVLPASAPVIRVMSYNIHVANPPSMASDYRDLPAIARVINQEKPDLVALSEVDNRTARSGSAVNQAQELGRLTGMDYFFSKAMSFQGGEYGDAVLSRLPILESARYELPVSDESFEPRSMAMITVEKAGRKIHFASAHLDHTADEANRVLQAREMVKIIEGLSGPMVIAGDMNARPESEPIKILRQVLTPTCADGERLFTFSAIHPERTIDYIMFTPQHEFEVLSCATVNETYASDHLPLVAELALK